MNKRHNFNRKRSSLRLLREIERQEKELLDSRQSWDEWIYLHNMRALALNGKERG